MTLKHRSHLDFTVSTGSLRDEPLVMKIKIIKNHTSQTEAVSRCSTWTAHVARSRLRPWTSWGHADSQRSSFPWRRGKLQPWFHHCFVETASSHPWLSHVAVSACFNMLLKQSCQLRKTLKIAWKGSLAIEAETKRIVRRQWLQTWLQGFWRLSLNVEVNRHVCCMHVNAFLGMLMYDSNLDQEWWPCPQRSMFKSKTLHLGYRAPDFRQSLTITSPSIAAITWALGYGELCITM